MTKLTNNQIVEIKMKKEINLVNGSGNKKDRKLYQST